MTKLLFRLGLWCFRMSGRRVDYMDALADAQAARELADVCQRRAEAYSRAFVKLLRYVKLADGLLSSDRPDEAQAQLRMGIIESGGIATPPKRSRRDLR